MSVTTRRTVHRNEKDAEKNEASDRAGAARRAAKLAADVAIGGTALTVDKAIETVDQVVERAGEVLAKQRREARENAAEAVRSTRMALEGHDSRPYEERTRDELYELAVERDIAGRSSMRKAELIEALRAER